MAASWNSVTLLGNLTREPEFKHTQGGMEICEFGMAVNEKRKGKEDLVLFIDVAMFDKQAAVAGEYLQKGSQILLQGKLKLDQWSDKETGAKRSKISVVGNSFQMLGSPGGKQPSKTEDEYPQAPPKQQPTDDGEIPFSWVGLLVSLAAIGGSTPWLT